MKKQTFLILVTGVLGGLLFGLGLCMCLLPQWNAFQPGVACTAVGFAVLLVLAIACWAKSGRKIRINWRLTGKVAYGIVSSLVLGVGMCLVLVWNYILPGIALGALGIVMLLFLIPMCLGWK